MIALLQNSTNGLGHDSCDRVSSSSAHTHALGRAVDSTRTGTTYSKGTETGTETTDKDKSVGQSALDPIRTDGRDGMSGPIFIFVWCEVLMRC